MPEEDKREPVPLGEHPELGSPMTRPQVAARLGYTEPWIHQMRDKLPSYQLDGKTMMLVPKKPGHERQGQQIFHWSADVERYEREHPRPDKTKKAIPSFSEEDEREILRIAQEQIAEKGYVAKGQIQRQMKKPTGFYTTIEYIIDKYGLPKSPKGRQYTYEWCEA